MANDSRTAPPSLDLAVSALEAAVIHLAGQSRAFRLLLEAAMHEIGSVRDDRAAGLVEALQVTSVEAAEPGTVRHLERAATELLTVLREGQPS